MLAIPKLKEALLCLLAAMAAANFLLAWPLTRTGLDNPGILLRGLFGQHAPIIVPAIIFAIAGAVGALILVASRWRPIAKRVLFVLLGWPLVVVVTRMPMEAPTSFHLPVILWVALFGVLPVLWWCPMRPAFLLAAGAGPMLLGSLIILNSLTSRGLQTGPIASLGHGSAGKRPDVHLIVLDEMSLMPLLHDNQLDDRVVPNLVALSRQATWYRNAATNYDFTTFAVPTLCTGRLVVTADNMTHSSIRDASIFERLSGHYQINMVSDWRDCEEFDGQWHTCIDTAATAGPSLAFASLAIGYLEWMPIEQFLPTRVSIWGNGALKATEILNVRRFVELAPASTAPPTLNYLHSLLTHIPWSIDEHGNVVAPPYNWEDDVTEDRAAALRRRYDASIKYTDKWLGTYFQRLKDAGRFDHAMIIVASDHGISFDTSQFGRLRGYANDWIVRIPLIVKFPDQRIGHVDDRNISLVDVAPLVLEALGFSADGMQRVGHGIDNRTEEPVVFHSLAYRLVISRDRLVPYRVDVERGIYERTQ